MNPLINKESSKNTKIITTKEISEILGLSDRRIRQLADEGALVRIAHGKFDLPASIQTYIKYQVNKEKPTAEIDKTEEEALWTRARRQKTELELRIMQGELHRSEDVKRVMNDMLGAFRARLLGLPSKISPQLIGKTEIPAVKEIVKNGVYEALEELSDYDPYVFYDYSNDNLLLDDEKDEESNIDSEIIHEELKNGRKKAKK